MKQRIIKRGSVQGEEVEAAAFERIENRRLPQQRVKMDETDAPDAEAPPGPVLQREATQVQDETITIDADEFVPDFPLSEDQERAQQSRAAEREPEPESFTVEELEAMKASWREEADAEWAERLAAAEAAAEERGFEAGYEAAERKMQQVLHDQTKAFAQDARTLESSWADFLEEAEPLLSELALEATAAMLDAPLPEEVRAAARTSIGEAIEALSTDPPLRVTMHPVDYLRLQEDGFVEQMESLQSDMRWEADPELDEGDWIVASPAATVRRVRQEMTERLRGRLGLAPS